jgi:hypothetical protein
MKTDTWKFDCESNNYDNLLDCIKNTEHKKHLYILNTKNESFDVIEKFVYDTAKSHFDRLGLDIDKHFIEFWYKKQVTFDNDPAYKINNFHVDCDESEVTNNNKYYKPLLSCVTYFNTNCFPTLITKISIDDYKFKNFDNKKQIQLVFPEEKKQISFDGTNFHGVTTITSDTNICDRFMLAINLWDRTTTNVPFYKNDLEQKYNKNDVIFTIENTTNPKIIKNNTPIFDFDFYEKMLYSEKNSFKLPEQIIKEIDLNLSRNYIFSDCDEIDFHEKSIEIKDLLKIKNDIDKINTMPTLKDSNDMFYNRFLQRFIYSSIFSKNACEWLISESELYASKNNGWSTHRHKEYPTTDLPVEKISSIFNFCLSSMNDILDKIKKSYCLPEYIYFNINDMFIVKYDSESQNKLEEHHDGSFFSVNILLSDPNNFEGGGTSFKDGINVFLNQGDVLVHSGKISHSGNKIIKGKRYLLVVFINILVNVDPELKEYFLK